MPLKDQITFIKDKRTNMTVREKNEQLSAELAIAPNVKRKISMIERIEIGGSGWRIHYRTGTL
jgi:hypothetical protein